MLNYLNKFYFDFKYALSFLFALFIILDLTGCSKSLLNQETNYLIDVNGDKKSDLIFWNNRDEDCFFETVIFPSLNYQLIKLGKAGDIPVYGDFTGDDSTDYGVYRYSDGGNSWVLIDGLSNSIFGNRFGEIGDLPVPADYDGDGRFDFVVYRPRNSGFYGNLSNKNKLLEIHFGITGDIPVPSDYDGDSQADLAVYTPASRTWLIRSSKNNLTKQIKLGDIDYLPIPNDYDGDRKTDLAVWNYKNNDCKINFSRSSQYLSNETSLKIQGKLKDIKCFPVPSDFDGDGKSELAFWEYNKNLLHIFNVKSNDFKYTQTEIKVTNGSEPINCSLLHKYLNKNCLISVSDLYKKFKSTLATGQKELKADFDGDGKDDVGSVDFKSKSFTYFSPTLERSNNIALNNRINGIPFAYDIDFDFMSDLIFYNPETNIFGFLKSSENYRYDEVLYQRNGEEKQ